jgi:hypothetical protein
VTLPHLARAYPNGVVAAAGQLWTVELHPSNKVPGTTVVRRDPGTGREETSYAVPGEDFGIAYGLGMIWTWGAAAGGPPASDVSVIDPETGHVRTLRVSYGPIEDVAFADGLAWFTQPDLNRVLRIAPLGRTRPTTLVADGARDIAPLGTASVVVLGSSGSLLDLPDEVFINRNDPTLTMLAAAPQYGVWLAHGRNLTHEPAIDLPLDVSLRLPLPVREVLGDPADGAYIATQSEGPQRYDPYLVYYSPQALASRHPRPTALLDGRVRVESMTSGPDGGVVFVTTSGALVSWNPSRPTAG